MAAASFAAAIAVTSCTGPAEPADPLASLAWPELSTLYTAEYWTEQAKADTGVWREATALCADATRQLLPNCVTIRQLQFILTLKDSAGRQSPAYDGQGGVEMPAAIQQQLDQSQTADDPPPPPGAEPVP